MEVRGHERETKREKKRKAGISSASRKLMVHAHPWLKIFSFSRFPSFRFRPKPSFSSYKTRFSFLYPPIALSHKFKSSFHSFFPSNFLCASFVTALAPLSIFYSHILFLLAISLDFFSCSILCKKELSKEEYIMYYDEYIFVEFFCFNINLWLCKRILIWRIDNSHITRYFYNTILIFSI